MEIIIHCMLLCTAHYHATDAIAFITPWRVSYARCGYVVIITCSDYAPHAIIHHMLSYNGMLSYKDVIMYRMSSYGCNYSLDVIIQWMHLYKDVIMH